MGNKQVILYIDEGQMCNYKNAELLVFVSNSAVLPAGLHSVGNTVLLLPLTVVLVLLCGPCEIGVVVHEPALHVLQFLQLEADFQSKTTTTVASWQVNFKNE